MIINTEKYKEHTNKHEGTLIQYKETCIHTKKHRHNKKHRNIEALIHTKKH